MKTFKELRETFVIYKNGKPLKIKGKEVTTTSKQSALKTIQTLSKKSFNKDATFAIAKRKSAPSAKPARDPDAYKRYTMQRKGIPDWRYAERGESVEEARKDSAKDVYWQSYSLAVRHALAQAKKKGFEIDQDDIDREISFGSGKPGRGKTVRHTLPLKKNGKEQRKALHIQVYNRDTDKSPFELNFYIS
jgi:hypothetical protein